VSVEIVLTGGRIFRGLAGGFAEAMAIADGKVAAVGAAEEIAALAGPDTRRIDLAGRVAIPAFNEAHMHLLPYGLGLSQVNLRADGLDFVMLDQLPKDHRYFDMQRRMQTSAAPSEMVVVQDREQRGKEYRDQTEGEHPIVELREPAAVR